MNTKHTDSEESLDLPWPQVDQRVGNANEAGGVQGNSEVVQSMAMESGLTGPAMQPPASQFPPQVAGAGTFSPPPQPTGVSVPGAQGTPAIADDIDLIEREWVNIAKEIVEQTKHDPHAQNEAMNKVKADYIKKRYNKELKIEEN